MGTLTQSKYRVQGYAVCTIGARIRYGDLSTTHRRSGDLVEDAGHDVDLIRAVIGECENEKKLLTMTTKTLSHH